MNTYELLLEESTVNGVTVLEHYDFSGTNIKGLYCDSTIALSKDLSTTSEKNTILAEELGHHYTAVGNILDQYDPNARKQELKGRAYAYNQLIGLQGLISCYQHRCSNISDMAELLEVTPEFMADALYYYRSKYGTSTRIGDYIIFFDPVLSVMRLI